MLEPKSAEIVSEISRDRLAGLLNEDLSREYQAIHRLRSLFPGAERC